MGVNASKQSSKGQETSDQHSMGYQEAGSLGLSRSGTQFQDEIGELLRQGMAGYGDYSKEAALADVNGTIKNQALSAMQAAMPTIAKTNTAAGAYNSTTRDLLANDFQSRLAGQLAETQLQAVSTYGGLQNNRLGALANTAQAGSTSESVNMSGSVGLNEALQQSQGSRSSSGSSMGLSFADGGKVPKNPNGTETLATGSTKPFSLFGEFFKFDGKGGRNSGLTILPSMLDLMGVGDSGEGSGNTDIGGPNPNKPVTPTTPATPEDPAKKPSDDMSPEARAFLRRNKIETLDEAIKMMDGSDVRSSVADPRFFGLLGSVDGIKEFEGKTAAYDAFVKPFRTSEGLVDRFAADGGQLPENPPDTANILRRMFADNLFASARNRREVEAGTQAPATPPASAGVVVNIGQPAGQSTEPYGGFERPGGTLQRRQDGGTVENSFSNPINRAFTDNIFERTRQEREAAAGLGAAPVVVNIGQPQLSPVPKSTMMDEPAPMQQPHQKSGGFFSRLLGLEDGGMVDDSNLQSAIQKYASTGQAPHINERTNSNGKLGGPQTKTGRDNQIVAVAGGEGVIPKDVMEVEGVPELLRSLIQTYHTKVQ